MRLFYFFLLIRICSFSQSNEVVINQAVQAAESQNITMPSQAIQALKASGMTEAQARQLASQRGLSYDQLLNEFFADQNSENSESEQNPESEEGEENEEEN